jgi:hypothetical protein
MASGGGGYTADSSAACGAGDWLSWLERTVHIREVTGSNPVSPTTYPTLTCDVGAALAPDRVS